MGKSLLSEIRQGNDGRIKDAINKVVRARITYNDKKGGKGKHERYILPIAYGLTKSGKPAIRAFQTAGSTKRGIPKWKLFLLDNIIQWSNGKRSFKDYSNELEKLGLNTRGSGDEGMTKLFAISPLCKANVSIESDSSPITSNPITKQDVEPKTQKVSPKANVPVKKVQNAPVKQKNTIDKPSSNSYLKNKIEAPSTEPVSKSDIQTVNVQNNNDALSNKQMKPKTAPVFKDDLSKSDNNLQNNKLTSTYRDMMDRWNSLDNENDEEKN